MDPSSSAIPAFSSLFPGMDRGRNFGAISRLFFLPFALYLLWQHRETLWHEKKIRLLVDCSLSILPWLALLGWIGYRGFGHTQQFMERGSYGLWTTVALYYSMFETYLFYWPWAITYGLFVCGIAGIVGLYRGNREDRQFLIFILLPR
jgi:hypothetical protein